MLSFVYSSRNGEKIDAQLDADSMLPPSKKAKANLASSSNHNYKLTGVGSDRNDTDATTLNEDSDAPSEGGSASEVGKQEKQANPPVETKLAPAYDICVTLYDILTYALSVPIIPNLVVGPYKCIYNFALHMEGRNMQNLFSADPRTYTYTTVGTEGRWIVHASDNSDASFFTVGVVTKSALMEGRFLREVNIKPLALTIYKKGIQFAMVRKPGENLKELALKMLPMDGDSWPSDPSLGCRCPFRLTEYPKLNLDYNDLDEGDITLVVFTVRSYKIKDHPNMVSFNIQFAIQLVEYNACDQEPGETALALYLCDELALGVDNDNVMPIIDESWMLLPSTDIDVPVVPGNWYLNYTMWEECNVPIVFQKDGTYKYVDLGPGIPMYNLNLLFPFPPTIDVGYSAQPIASSPPTMTLPPEIRNMIYKYTSTSFLNAHRIGITEKEGVLPSQAYLYSQIVVSPSRKPSVWMELFQKFPRVVRFMKEVVIEGASEFPLNVAHLMDMVIAAGSMPSIILCGHSEYLAYHPFNKFIDLFTCAAVLEISGAYYTADDIITLMHNTLSLHTLCMGGEWRSFYDGRRSWNPPPLVTVDAVTFIKSFVYCQEYGNGPGMFQDKVFNIVSHVKMSKLETLNAFVWNNTATGLQTFLNMVGETLNGAGLPDNLEWHHINGCDIVHRCSSPQGPITVSLVAVTFANEWYNKLSGVGDYNEANPKPFHKLKWLLHFKAPVDTMFSPDWDIAIRSLGHLQDQIKVNELQDMLVNRKGILSELRTTANMFKIKAKLGTDTTTTRYVIPAEHMNTYQDMTTHYELNPIDIRDCNGHALPMGSTAEQAVGGSLCLLMFQIRHYYIKSASRDSFNASLKSIRVLVPKCELPKMILALKQLNTGDLNKVSPFICLAQKSPPHTLKLREVKDKTGRFI
ncbi:hypothetical protein ARMGADRAFT_1079144 [Armillaria gallica]|uniref:Uncharacterized protein n=1 Tax=Armillaria gallica TaxID=47427 RepID=A0A2H3DGX1_ARMGA|nr:hypothetical protein ARMGADRAFT_1079144 [Armillaria gallica]